MNIVCLVLLIAATTFGFTKAYYENKYSQQNVMEQALENVDHIEYANDNIIIIDKQYNEWVYDDVENTESENNNKNELLELTYNKEVTRSVKVFYTNTESDLKEMFDFIEQKNNAIVVEISNGTVENRKTGDGVADNGSYICYDADAYEPGTRITSVFVYNPNTNYTDDILYRIDTVIGTTENIK